MGKCLRKTQVGKSIIKRWNFPYVGRLLTIIVEFRRVFTTNFKIKGVNPSFRFENSNSQKKR